MDQIGRFYNCLYYSNDISNTYWRKNRYLSRHTGSAKIYEIPNKTYTLNGHISSIIFSRIMVWNCFLWSYISRIFQIAIHP